MDTDILSLQRAAVESKSSDDEERYFRALERTGFAGYEPCSDSRPRERERLLSRERVSPFALHHGRPTAVYITVTISYSKGGSNMWHGTQEARGYWLHVGASNLEFSATDRVYCEITSLSLRMTGEGGSKFFIQDAARFSQKTLDAIDETHLASKIAEMKARIIVKKATA